jgi:hypothetical protein
MPSTVLFSFKKLANGRIMFHGTMADAKHAAEADLKAHASGCPDFGPAFRAGDTIEFAREVGYLPAFDGDAIEAWLDEELGIPEEDAEDEVIDLEPEEQ